MTQQDNSGSKPIHSASMIKRMLQGAVIAFIFIFLFLFGVEGKPEWGDFWKIRPLVVVPVAGMLGGVFYFFMDHLRYQGGWKTVLSYVISLFGYLVVLWLGTVLGLDGTLWN
ncbi:MAG: potassium transporter KefB [Cyclobacteriaceae bacterium]